MLHPYAQIELIHSFQAEKRETLLKGQAKGGKRPVWMSLWTARALDAAGRLLVRAGNGLQAQVEPRFNG